MKKIISFAFPIAVFCLLSVSAQAFTDGFVDQPIPYDANASLVMAGTSGYNYYGSNGRIISTIPNTFVFAVGNDCLVAGKSVDQFRVYDTNASEYGFYCSYDLVPNSGYLFNNSWWTTNSGIYDITKIPQFNSLDDAIAAMNAVIDLSAVTSSFSLPAGNVAYIKYSGSSVVLNCHQPISSTFGSSPWPNTNQYYGFSSYLPSSSTVFPLSNQNVIPWQRSGNPTIFGQYYDSSLTISGSTSQYLIVYNPYFSDLGNINFDPPNGDIVINVPNATQIIVYPILGSYSGGSLIGMSEDDWSSSFTAVIDSESGSVTFFNNAGDPSDPTIGGSNFSPEDITATGFLNKIVSVLEGVVKSLTSIFGFAYEAIISLVGLVSNFVAVLGGLYTWLPSPLYTVLVSAITLAITIGVFKVFL